MHSVFELPQSLQGDKQSFNVQTVPFIEKSDSHSRQTASLSHYLHPFGHEVHVLLKSSA